MYREVIDGELTVDGAFEEVAVVARTADDGEAVFLLLQPFGIDKGEVVDIFIYAFEGDIYEFPFSVGPLFPLAIFGIVAGVQVGDGDD